MAIEVIEAWDAGWVSPTHQVTKFLLRDPETMERRQITSMVDVEHNEFARRFFPHIARLLSDILALKRATDFVCFTRDKAIHDRFNVEYVQPGAPIPSDAWISRNHFTEDEDED